MNSRDAGHATTGRNLAVTASATATVACISTWPGLIEDVPLVVIEGGPHAIAWTHAGQVSTALLDFLRS